MKNIYLIVGASGTGKSTLVERLVKHYNAKEVLSYTDRKPRYEGEGTHIFVSEQEFNQLLPMIAYTEFDGHRYGVTQDIFDKSDFYVIDPAGIIFLYKNYRGNRPIKVIGLKTNNETLTKRLSNRDNSLSRIEHDKNIFTDSVMNLICDIVLDSSTSKINLQNNAIRVIDKFEEAADDN